MKNLAPIVIFTHARLNLLKRCINSLKKNIYAKNSKLYIFSDASENVITKKKIEQVRLYIKKIKGFRSIKIIKRKKNFGLAKNIIEGISEVFKKEKKIIVLEDDILVAKNFLFFMNQSLDYYSKNNKIWHISGWNYNITCKSQFDAYFTRGMNCWGWATWRNRWKYFEKKPLKIIKDWDKKMISEFNFNNSIDHFSRVVRNKQRKINTWAVFWYAKIFENEKLCLNPTKSLTQNIGIGKQAKHTFSVSEIYNSKLSNIKIKNFKLPKILAEDPYIYDSIQKKSKIGIIKKIVNYIS